MIASMTAFGSGKASNDAGSVSLELKTVNSRFLDIQFRMPDELRLAEQPLREKITKSLSRGKIEIRASFVRIGSEKSAELDALHLQRMASFLSQARLILPETPTPSLSELLTIVDQVNTGTTPELWAKACLQASDTALAELSGNRQREGARLAQAMLKTASDMEAILHEMAAHMPALISLHQSRLAQKLKDTLEHAYPNGFSHITGAEMFERITAETSLFSLRIDVAEELARLESHLQELNYLLANVHAPAKGLNSPKGGKTEATGVGKRLDFLFQEMNREANTLGSKSASMDMTRASMDLKLCIEQLREQAQNIE
jgi:uncharacterized protein (TIGR00255 family)